MVVAGSAGSLDAIKRFFGKLAPGSGAAFVVCVHRDAHSQGLLAELVAGFTTMPVQRLTSGARLSRDTVYVAPTNRSLTLSAGRIALGPQDRASGQIDQLFRSVAADEHENAVGILLSGMDNDGTLGLEAIRAGGGIALVQEPSTAPYPTMPTSAIEAGAADLIGSPEELALRMADLGTRVTRAPDGDATARDRALEAILGRILESTGHDLSHYKRSPFLRRVERRMGLRRTPNYASYLALLEKEPAESRQLFKDLLIGVTRFFREPDAFEVLRKDALPRILADERRIPPLRIWIAGCSTGEEAYSIAMVAREAMDQLPNKGDRALQIYATDLDEVAIERARRGHYSGAITEDVSPARLERFFTREEGGYRVRAEIRDSVIFATHDLTAHPPFTRLDVVCCRNVLIYLGIEAQRKLLALFHFALRSGGVLVLGGSESLGTWERAFEVVDSKTRVFRRREVAKSRRLPVEFPLRSSSMLALRSSEEAVHPEGNSVRELVRLALEELGVLPAATSSEPQEGKRTRSVKGVKAQNKGALASAQKHLLTLTETLESFRREAQVTHEELQSTNEELQSTNEELMTAREETQSMNEELLTLNAELSTKNEALEVTNDDMRNLLDSSLIPTVFLDHTLRIRRFTSQATRIANLLPTDVGRPLTDIVLLVDYADVVKDVEGVLSARVPVEKRVVSRDGSVFMMRIHPYRNAHEVVDGVVMSFVDVTELARAADADCDKVRREVATAMTSAWPGIGYLIEGKTPIVASETSAARLGRAPEEASATLLRALSGPEGAANAGDENTPARELRRGDGTLEGYDERRVALGCVGKEALSFVHLTKHLEA